VRRAILCFILLVACDKNDKPGTPATSATAPVATTTAAPTTPSASASASAAPTAAGAAASWEGKYKSAASGFYVPHDAPNGKDWKEVKWQGDQSPQGIGEGTLALKVDANGVVTGELEGPLGPGIVNGSVHDGQLTGSIRRKDATDGGFTGTLVGKVAGAAIEGTMKLSRGEASLIREAQFSLAKK
jgi:hypothetical protein